MKALINNLQRIASSTHAFEVKAEKDALFGPNHDVPVILLSTDNEITELHQKLLACVKAASATFDNPQYVDDGFVPHATVQKESKLILEHELTIDNFSLVDMYPDDDIYATGNPENVYLLG